MLDGRQRRKYFDKSPRKKIQVHRVEERGRRCGGIAAFAWVHSRPIFRFFLESISNNSIFYPHLLKYYLLRKKKRYKLRSLEDEARGGEISGSGSGKKGAGDVQALDRLDEAQEVGVMWILQSFGTVRSFLMLLKNDIRKRQFSNRIFQSISPITGMRLHVILYFESLSNVYTVRCMF